MTEEKRPVLSLKRKPAADTAAAGPLTRLVWYGGKSGGGVDASGLEAEERKAGTG
jgi:hypothetical protein